VVELDRLDTEKATPLRLIPETVLERLVCVLFAEVDVDRFGIVGLD
jgi:hypothetical protein